MGEGDRRAAILQLICLVRPVRERAARLLQTRLSEFRARKSRESTWVYDPDNPSWQPQQSPQCHNYHDHDHRQPAVATHSEHEPALQQQQQQRRGHTSNGSPRVTKLPTYGSSDMLLIPRIESAIDMHARKAQEGRGEQLPSTAEAERWCVESFRFTSSHKDYFLLVRRGRGVCCEYADISETSNSSIA